MIIIINYNRNWLRFFLKTTLTLIILVLIFYNQYHILLIQLLSLLISWIVESIVTNSLFIYKITNILLITILKNVSQSNFLSILKI